MKKIKCNFCKGKGYIEVTQEQHKLIFTKQLKKPYQRIHCPACYGMKFQWSKECK